MDNLLTRLLLLALLALPFGSITGQVSMNSPFSRFGLGLYQDPGSVRHFSMGGVVTPLADPSVINISNPATYTYLTETVFQVSGKGGLTQVESGELSSRYLSGNLQEVMIGFKKLGSPWAFVAGITPFSITGYQFEEEQAVFDSLSARYRYSGEGGTNRLVLGTGRSFELGRDSGDVAVQRLSVGVNVNYLFGSVDHSRRIIYSTNSLNHTRFTNTLQVADFFFDIGLHYVLPLKIRSENQKMTSGHFLHAGLDVSIGTRINTRFSELGESFYYLTTVEFPLDTSYFREDVRGGFDMPARLSAGLSYYYQNRRGGGVTLAADYRSQNWSNVTGTPEVSALTPAVLRAYRNISIGAEFLPEGLDKAGGFFKRMTYRAGVRQTNLNLILRDVPIVQYGVSMGLSIPLIASKSASRFHIGVEYSAIRGGDTGVDQYNTTLQVGFTLHPFERWFFQRKYD